MGKKQDWVERIKDLPNWIKGALGLATAIIGFIALILNNTYLGITVSCIIILVTLLSLSIYIAFSKKESEILGGGFVYCFPSHYRLGFVGVIIVPIVLIILLANTSSRKFAVSAFIGTTTSTPTITATVIPTDTPVPPTATPTDTPIPTLTNTPIPPTVTPTDTPVPSIVIPILDAIPITRKICIVPDNHQDLIVDISGGEIEMSLKPGERVCFEAELTGSQEGVIQGD